MKLAVPFTLNFKYDKWVDEYNIRYTDTSKVKNLKEFLDKYQNKRINILFGSTFEILDIIEEIKDYKNIVLVTPRPLNKEKYDYISKYGLSYYTLEPAYNYYSLNYLLSLGVCDIYIADDLWHTLPRIKDIVDSFNCRIRMIGDQAGTYSECSNPYIAFIPRPEDFILLSNYVEVIEFTEEKQSDLNVLYHAWFENFKWIDNINQICHKADIPNNHLVQDSYTYSKITCGARCLTNAAYSHCQKCFREVDFARALAEKNLVIKEK